MKKIRIFISSPSDVDQEKMGAMNVLKRLNRRYKKHLQIEGIIWDHLPFHAGQDFQTEIDNHTHSDIIIVILWSKLGSPLPSHFMGQITKTNPVTGTQWEFENAMYQNDLHGKPYIMVYKKSSEIVSVIGDDKAYKKKTEDKNRLDDFMKYWFNNKDGTFKGAFHSFKKLTEFENKLELHLEEWLKNYQDGIVRSKTEIDEKIYDLIAESLKAFKNQEIKHSLQSSKKCAEYIYQIIILEHNKSEKEYLDIKNDGKKLHEVIDDISEVIFKNPEKEFVKTHLRLLIFNGEYLSSDDLGSIGMTQENVKLSNISLQRLLKWLFIDYLHRPMPNELTRYLSKYDILINYNKTNEGWVNTLKLNLEAHNYKVLLIHGKNQKIEKSKKLNQAFSEIKANILVYSNNISDKRWAKKEHLWIKKQQREISEFKTISIYTEEETTNSNNKNSIDFSKEYKDSFSKLIDNIENKPTDISIKKIVMPADKNSFFTLKLFSILIFLALFGFFIFNKYTTYDEIDLYTASSTRSTYNMIGADIKKHIEKDTKININNREKSKGSYDNLKKLVSSDANRLTIAIVQADAMQKFITDPKNKNLINNLKIIAPLYKEEFHFLVKKDSNLTYFHQIKNMRMDIGKLDSGTEISSEAIYFEMFFNEKNITAYRFNKNPQDALRRLKAGETDIVTMVAGQPIQSLIKEKGIKLLKYDSKLLLQEQKRLGLLIDGKEDLRKTSYAQSDIKPQSYEWNDKYIHTLNTRAYLVVYDDGKNNQKLLEKFTKAYIKNLSNLRNLAAEKKVHLKWLEIPIHLEDKLPKGLSYSKVAKKIWDDISPQPYICKH